MLWHIKWAVWCCCVPEPVVSAGSEFWPWQVTCCGWTESHMIGFIHKLDTNKKENDIYSLITYTLYNMLTKHLKPWCHLPKDRPISQDYKHCSPVFTRDSDLLDFHTYPFMQYMTGCTVCSFRKASALNITNSSHRSWKPFNSPSGNSKSQNWPQTNQTLRIDRQTKRPLVSSLVLEQLIHTDLKVEDTGEEVEEEDSRMYFSAWR